MLTKERGAAVTIEATFLLHSPFNDTDTKGDPDNTPQVKVEDQNGVEVLALTNMQKNSVGEWYYNLQTLAAWRPGIYKITVTGTFSSLADNYVYRYNFVLN